MATKRKSSKRDWRNWQENYASFILGAIIVVILGLLVANFISNRNKSIDGDGTQTVSESPKAAAEKNAQAKPGEYKVVSGDSLSKIADKYYGDMMMWPVIAQANKISNPNIIEVDTTLKVPTKDEAVKIKETMSATSYKVESGDTLFTIAEKMYGDGSRWTLIDRANKVGRLPNGNPLIFAGNTLSIPR